MDLRQLGKYEIVGKIGQGAMGEVFKAHDPILGRDVAIKTMSAQIGADEELRKRFHREAQSAARLSHPNIITIFDFGEDQGKVYMAMELLEGDDLKDLIGRHTPMSLERKLEIMEQICDGLAFAHAKDVVHRDLKPANLHIQRGGQVKIMDFGLAKMASSDMTRAGMIMGTPNYMSPEQVRGEKATSRSDVFSVGAVFYELLTNRKPFEADSLHAVLFQVMQNEPESLATAAPGVPPVLRQVVERAMLKDAAGRYRDGAELREALRPVRASLAEWTAGASLPPTSDATIVGNVVITPPPPAPRPATRPPSPPPDPQTKPPLPAEPTVAHLSATPIPRVVGTNALEPAPRKEEPATVAPTDAGTLSGRASTQVPSAAPPAASPGPATPIPQSAPPAPVAAPPPTALKVEPPPAPTAPPPEPTRTIAAKGKDKKKDRDRPTGPLAAPPPVAPPPQAPPKPAPPVVAAPAARLTPPPTSAPVSLPPRPVESPRSMPPEPVRLSGETTRPQTVASAGSKLPIVAGGVVAVIVLGVGAYMLTRPPDPTPSPSPTPAAVTTTLAAVEVDPAVAGHVDAAQKALAAKDYKAAVARADQALEKDAQNAAARQVREQAQASLQKIDAAAAAARKALAANDTAAAGRAVEELTALDPTHPAIAEARTQLQAFFKARAEQAKREMEAAQRAATAAKATTQADFKSAVLLAREGESLAARGDLAPAAQKFVEARDAYERARRAQSQAATATPTPVPTPAATAAPSTTTMPVQTTTTTTAPAAPVNEEPAIRRLLAEFERAYETGDTGLWQRIFPGTSGDLTKAVAAKNWKDVNITVNSIDLQGPAKATVRIGRRDLGLDGKTYPFQQTLVVVKDGSGWKISSIGR